MYCFLVSERLLKNVQNRTKMLGCTLRWVNFFHECANPSTDWLIGKTSGARTNMLEGSTHRHEADCNGNNYKHIDNFANPCISGRDQLNLVDQWNCRDFAVLFSTLVSHRIE